jgi:Zn-dependent membrane protease YugP
VLGEACPCKTTPGVTIRDSYLKKEGNCEGAASAAQARGESAQVWALSRVVACGSQVRLPLVFVGIFIGPLLFIQLAAILFMTVLAFHVVRLLVEINASTRAYGLLTRYGILSGTEAGGTRRVLTAAAFTYIAAALTAFLTLMYLLLTSQNEQEGEAAERR